MLKAGKDISGGLEREGLMVERKSSGSKGVSSHFKHALGEVDRGSMSGNTKVAEHGIGFSAAKELDDVSIHVRAEKRSGASCTS